MTVDDLLRRAATDLLDDVRAEVDPSAALDRVRAAPASRPRGRWSAVAAVVLVLAGAVGVVVASSGDGGDDVHTDETPSTTAPLRSVGLPFTVTPRIDLRDGDEVRIRADDVAGGSDVSVSLCGEEVLTPGADLGPCRTLEAQGEFPVTPDGVVDVDLTAVVRRASVLDDGSTLDCGDGTTRCAIALVAMVVDQVDGSRSTGHVELAGAVEVAFAEGPAPAVPEVAVDEDRGLVHGQEVTITGTGVVAKVAQMVVCAVGPPDAPCVALSPPAAEQVATDADGAFTVAVQVWRRFGDGFGGPVVDCAEVACELRVAGADGRAAAPVPLGFDPSAPAPQPPRLEVTPTEGLRPGDPVTITVTGLAPGQVVALDACLLGGSAGPDRCGYTTGLDQITAGADGVAVTTVPAVDPQEWGVACTGPGQCALALGSRVGEVPGGDPLLAEVPPQPVRYAP